MANFDFPTELDAFLTQWMSRSHPEVGESFRCKATGELYAELMIDASGQFFERKDPRSAVKWFETLEEAWRAWVEGFHAYTQERTGTIHWRCQPEWIDRLPMQGGGFTIYARAFVEKAS